MSDFEIENLDHVGLFVADVGASVDWYRSVLGLVPHTAKEWGKYPVFMLAGRTGLALFPAKLDDPEVDPESSNVRLHHFLSVYLQDPDGHRVELTTLDSRPGDFYAS